MKIAVLLPCHNEQVTIFNVVTSFQRVLPGAAVYVYDNNSTDNTAVEARRAGAIVCSEPRKGKGHVVRRMFADVDADVYVMADGDGTYEAAAAPHLIEALVRDRLDMVVGARVADDGAASYRPGHRWGNRILTRGVALIFGRGFRDMLSGYRVFSRRFVKTFPVLSSGFEIETEMTIHALTLTLPCAELDTKYGARPQGSASKLKTWQDGFLILRFIALLFKEIKPFVFFTILALALAALSVALAAPVVSEFFATGLVPRLPTAVLSAAVMLCGVVAFVCGVILDSVSRGRREMKRLAYLGASWIKSTG